MKNCFLLVLIGIFLSACSSNKITIRTPEPNGEKIQLEPFDLDDNYASKSYNTRMRSIIVHYTAIPREASLRILTNGGVSSHFLVTDNPDDDIFIMVPEEKRAWHAGISFYDKRSDFNDISLGIEIVYVIDRNNPTYNGGELGKFLEDFSKKNGSKKLSQIKAPPNNIFPEYTEDQIKKVAYLIAYLKDKYEIRDKYILGHGDIAPQRKIDPGPKFPWKRLFFEYNIGYWYDAQEKDRIMSSKIYNYETISTIKKEFIKFGYDMNDTPTWDNAAKKVVYAFQTHFRPEKADGIVDKETFAILKALNLKYINYSEDFIEGD
ncbi:MAG: N-acetylmuramoyl-L-alanine amidase [Fusobacteriaceae bacterium]